MLEFNYIKNLQFSKLKYVKSIIFNTTKSGKYESVIIFNNKITEIEAILVVEKFLSEKITKDYIDSHEDNFNNINIKYRGDLLEDCIYLNKIKNIKNDQIKLEVNIKNNQF